MTVPSGPVTSAGEVGQSSHSTRLMLVRECSLSKEEGEVEEEREEKREGKRDEG